MRIILLLLDNNTINNYYNFIQPAYDNQYYNKLDLALCLNNSCHSKWQSDNSKNEIRVDSPGNVEKSLEMESSFEEMYSFGRLDKKN